jgi:hypothetical protein
MYSDHADLQREVAAELRLAESSRPEVAMREPIENWRFDPTEVLLYLVVLRGLLRAAQVGGDPALSARR